MRPDSFVLSSTNRAFVDGLREITYGTMPNPIIYMRQRPMLYYGKTGALSQYTLDMGHTEERDPGRSIKAQLLRPLLRNRIYRTDRTYRSFLEKQDVDGCGDTFITV